MKNVVSANWEDFDENEERVQRIKPKNSRIVKDKELIKTGKKKTKHMRVNKDIEL